MRQSKEKAIAKLSLLKSTVHFLRITINAGTLVFTSKRSNVPNILSEIPRLESLINICYQIQLLFSMANTW